MLKLKKTRGISLIALIITIIVIIILAAVVVASALDTPERAMWARFTSDYAEIEQQVSVKAAELYGKYAMDSSVRIPAYTEIYHEIATGMLPESGDAKLINEIEFKGNNNITMNKPSYGGNWYIEADGKISYSGYTYEGQTWITPTEQGKIEANMVISDGSYNAEAGVNRPKLTNGMIPICYDDESGNWKKADVNNPNGEWYKYSEKKWANICTVSDEVNNVKKYREAAAGTTIPENDMTTMFVWIPRYAYSIVSGLKTSNTEAPSVTNAASAKIDVTFLKGISNKDSAGTSYGKDYNLVAATMPTPKIVHPGFKFGSKELPGIWVAKFEASGMTQSGSYVGNASASSGTPVLPDDTTYVKIVPSVPSWRHITIGESQYQSMRMGPATAQYGWINVNTHLTKSTEWGTVAYLCYSNYGIVPMINGAGMSATAGHYYDLYTGAGPNSTSSEAIYSNYTDGTKGYRTTVGKLASTTGNIYGVYDMSGGAYEMIASYFDNKHNNLNIYGKSTSNTSVVYFVNGELKSEYSNYFDKYEVSNEERNNQIVVEGEGSYTQAQLEDVSKIAAKYNEARLRIAIAKYDKLPKGIGVSEITGNFSFYGAYNDGSKNTWNWFTTVANATAGTVSTVRSWNNDSCIIVGPSSSAFVMYGGDCRNATNAGILRAANANGSVSSPFGFRPVLVP